MSIFSPELESQKRQVSGQISSINMSNIGRAVPSFGILVIAFQVFGLGDLPIVIALTALAVPPMVTNSYVALREVRYGQSDAPTRAPWYVPGAGSMARSPAANLKVVNGSLTGS